VLAYHVVRTKAMTWLRRLREASSYSSGVSASRPSAMERRASLTTMRTWSGAPPVQVSFASLVASIAQRRGSTERVGPHEPGNDQPF
jgi:hypothetical protein